MRLICWQLTKTAVVWHWYPFCLYWQDMEDKDLEEIKHPDDSADETSWKQLYNLLKLLKRRRCIARVVAAAARPAPPPSASHSYELSKQPCGWGLITTHHCPQFWRSKKNSNSTQFIELYFGVLEQIKSLQSIVQAAEFKFESNFELLPTSAGHLAITPEGIRLQNKALGAALQHSLGG